MIQFDFCSVTYLENGAYLEAFRKAKEALHLHPWHLTEENDTAASQSIWSALKKIFLTVLHRFAGLMTTDSAKLTAALPEIMSDLCDLERKRNLVFFSKVRMKHFGLLQNSPRTHSQMTLVCTTNVFLRRMSQ